MTATVTYKVEEGPIDVGQLKYQFRMIDMHGNAVLTSRASSRERCIQALKQSGFTITE